MLLNDRYRLEVKLGQGGMGTIYSAHDTLLDRDVAVKLLSKHALGTEGRARLLREAQAAARLNHPNIVSVYDAGEAEGNSYIIMELVEGDSLHQRPPANLEELLSITRQICLALDHAHQHQIVHRDLKPENVLVTPDGTVKLTDFGLARPVASRLTSEGAIVGTVYYLSPEQALGREVDGRADLYALGVMLYEFTTGQLPFTAEEPLAVITQHLYAPVTPPKVHNPQLNPALDALIIQLMNKTPDERPASATEVIRRLEPVALTWPALAIVEEPDLLERITRGRIIGRSRELAEVRSLWERAVSGEGQMLLISGEPGIGKTRLSREAITLAEISGGKVLVGECYPEISAPYAPFAQVFRRALSNGAVPDLDLPAFILADLLSIAPDLQLRFPGISANPRLDPQSEQQRLFENIVAFFTTLCRRQPTLLVLEDAHWADQASLFLLRHLARRLRRQPIMMITTYREVELDEALPFQEVLLSIQRERLASRLKLARLQPDDTRRLLAALLNEQVPEAFVQGIYHETEGNPFFIEEVCKSLVESGRLSYVDGRWQHPALNELQIPQSVRVAIQARLGKLPAEYQDILRMAAILGRDFDYEVLAQAVELDEEHLIEALEQAEHAQLIEETGSQNGGTFRFVHALIPTTLKEGLIGLRRRKLHRLAAEALEKYRPDDLETLAYQYAQAEVPEKALQYLSQAGRRAQARYANDDAIRYYSAALEFCEEENDCFDLLRSREQVYHHTARRPEELADLQRMYALANSLDDNRLRFDALLARANYAAHTDFVQATQPAEQALALAVNMNDPVRQARALYILAFVANFNGDQRRCIRFLDQAKEKFQAAGQVSDVIPCLYLLSLAHINKGEDEAGQQAAEQAVQLSREIKDRRQEATSLRRLGIAMDARDRKTEALELYQSALILHREVGDRAEECNALNAMAGVLASMGRLDEARQYFDEGLELAESIGQDMAVGMIVANMAFYCYQAQGDYQGALDLLERQLERARSQADQGLIFALSRSVTEMYASIGLYEEALVKAETALQIAEQRDLKRAQIDLLAWCGRLHAILGNFGIGHTQMDAALEMAQASDDPESYPDVFFNLAYTAWLGNDPAEWRQGLAYSSQVSARWRDLDAEYPLTFSLDMEARLMLALGEPALAAERTTDAVALADRLAGFTSQEQMYFTHACALRAVGRSEEADEYLRRAYERVRQAAAGLTSEKLQRAWLENVRYNREIIAEWQARFGEKD